MPAKYQRRSLEVLREQAIRQMPSEEREQIIRRHRAKHRAPDSWTLLDRFTEILERRHPPIWSERAELARETLQRHFEACGYASALTTAERERRVRLVLEFEQRISE